MLYYLCGWFIFALTSFISFAWHKPHFSSTISESVAGSKIGTLLVRFGVIISSPLIFFSEYTSNKNYFLLELIQCIGLLIIGFFPYSAHVVLQPHVFGAWALIISQQILVFLTIIYSNNSFIAFFGIFYFILVFIMLISCAMFRWKWLIVLESFVVFGSAFVLIGMFY